MDELELLESMRKEAKAILKYLDQLSPEDERYSVASDNYSKLCKLIMELEKGIKDRQDQNIHKIVGYALDFGKLVLMLVTYKKLYEMGLKFEETGSLSAHPTRNLIGSFNPFRKF